jgi:calcineurin-like phosphoesterase family protein
MNDKLIQNWNEIVPDDGIVFHLGDVALKAPQKGLNDILHELNGIKYRIKGIHEKSALHTEYLKSHWEGIFDILDINVYDESIKHKQQKIVLCHYPMLTWNGSHRDSWNLFGHCHGNLGKNHAKTQLDVGVDCHNFYPISYEQVKNKILI